MKKVIILIVVVLAVFISIKAYQHYLSIYPYASINPVSDIVIITNFNNCISAGNPAMESYPRKCRSGNQTFIEDIGNELEKMDLIRIDTPRPNQLISSPLQISGEARGYWFFEGDFPIEIYDGNNNLLGSGYATADGDWMTEGFVFFISELEFTTPDTKTGLLILKKDNPSDLTENDDQLEVPVVFK